MGHILAGGVIAALIGCLGRPWRQAMILLPFLLIVSWYDFIQLRARLGERMLYDDPAERLLLAAAVHLFCISVGWAFGRFCWRHWRVRA